MAQVGEMYDPAVSMEEVSRLYGGRGGAAPRVAVSCLNLEVKAGTVLGLLGPNGAGKSTTIAMLAGLVAPSSGDVRICGHSTITARAKAVARVATALDRARGLYPRLTPAQNIAYFAAVRGRGRDATARGRDWLERLGAGAYANARMNTLSLGTQQKVVLACAMAMRPDVLLLDEPTLGLDLPSSLELRSAISMLAEDDGKCVVLSTHQMDVAQSVCHEVCVMAGGRAIAYGSVEQLVDVFSARAYSISVRGAIHPVALRSLSQVAVVRASSQSSGVAGSHGRLDLEFADERAVYRAIDCLRAAGLEIESVARTEPCLESAYARLIAGGLGHDLPIGP